MPFSPQHEGGSGFARSRSERSNSAHRPIATGSTERVQGGSSNARRWPRKTRAWWFDVRLVIGMALVAASVVGVYTIVSAADETTPVYTARAALAPGDRVSANDLVVTDVRLGSGDSLYLASGDMPDSGVVATRAIAAGELVPVSSLGNAVGLTATTVVVTVRGQLAESVRGGSIVDVWTAREATHDQYGPPSVLIAAATVVLVSEPDGIIAGNSGAAVELLIPKEKTAAMLEATANNDAISLVPVNQPMKK